MRPRDWFLVGLRLIGVWIFYHAVGDVLTAGVWALDLGPQESLGKYQDTHSGLQYNLWFAAGYGALALYFVFGAEGLTKWIFDEYPPDSDAVEDDAG
jgi:hypothetical protein